MNELSNFLQLRLFVQVPHRFNSLCTSCPREESYVKRIAILTTLAQAFRNDATSALFLQIMRTDNLIPVFVPSRSSNSLSRCHSYRSTKHTHATPRNDRRREGRWDRASDVLAGEIFGQLTFVAMRPIHMTLTASVQ